MSKIIALAAAVILLGLSACKSVNEPAAHPAAAQPAPEANVAPQAPKVAEVAAPAPTEPTPAVAAKPVDAAPAAAAAKPADEVKPATPAAVPVKPKAPSAPAKAETPSAPAAKANILTKEQALALAGKGNCLACHKIESKVVGPAWKDVAAKYKGDANAVSTITSHIKSGGSFGWKFGTMPPRGGSKISDAEVASLASFIASLK